MEMLEQHSFFYYITLCKGYTRAVNILLQRSVTVFAVDWSDCMLRIMLTNRHFSSIILAFLFVLMANYLAVSSNPVFCYAVFLFHIMCFYAHILCGGMLITGKPAGNTRLALILRWYPSQPWWHRRMVYRWEKRWYLLRIIMVVQL